MISISGRNHVFADLSGMHNNKKAFVLSTPPSTPALRSQHSTTVILPLRKHALSSISTAFPGRPRGGGWAPVTLTHSEQLNSNHSTTNDLATSTSSLNCLIQIQSAAVQNPSTKKIFTHSYISRTKNTSPLLSCGQTHRSLTTTTSSVTRQNIPVWKKTEPSHQTNAAEDRSAEQSA